MLLTNTAAVPGLPAITGIFTIVSLPVLATNSALPALLKPSPLAPNGGTPGGGEQRISNPGGSDAAARTGFPDDAIEGIRHVDVARGIEGERVETGAAGRGRHRHEHGRCAGIRVDLEHLGGAEVDHQQRMGCRMEADAQQMRCRAGDALLPDQLAVLIEDVKLPKAADGAAAAEAECRDVNIAVRCDRETLRAGRSIRQDREDVGVAAIPGMGGRWHQPARQQAGAQKGDHTCSQFHGVLPLLRAAG